MKKHKVSVDWKRDLVFNLDVDKHLIVLNGNDDGRGLCPKPMMLASLGGCSAFDVVDILEKDDISFDNFEIEVEGELSKDTPRIYTQVHLVYRFKGSSLNKEALKEAVRLSVEEQCGVLRMFKSFAKVTYEVAFE